MAPRTRRRFFKFTRNAFTLLLLGFLGIIAAYLLSTPRVTDVIPVLPIWLLSLLGWIHIGIGCLLLISGIANQQRRDLVARLEDLLVAGPFRYCRRPMYGGLSVLLIGSGMVLNLMSLVYTAAIWSLIASVYSQFEDKELKHRLGQDYRYYRQTTPLLFPHLGRIIADFFRSE